ncbi:unnamed protein product [Lymnaea stagnalis]|uniref:Uncharacterized protein n=1 Tax=Lymnaea stagnalis TaxID=6523 RepID=A0AAV2GX59_LYMST
MFLVYFIVCWYSCITRVGAFIPDSSLYDVSHGKPMMISPPGFNKFKIRLTHNGTLISCNKMKPEVDHFATFYLDLAEVFPVVQIHITGYHLPGYVNSVAVYLDDKFCARPFFNHSDNGVKDIRCSEYLKGRMLTIKAGAEFYICSVVVYTCRAGLYGPTCQSHCPPGTFGLGCVHRCACRKGGVCNATTGFCPSGCQSTLADGNFGCAMMTVTNSKVSMIRATKTPVKDIQTSPFLDVFQNIILTNTVSRVFASFTPWYFSNPCLNLRASGARRVVSIRVMYEKEVSLEGAILNHTFVNISPPFSMLITADGRACYGAHSDSSAIMLGRHSYICQRKGLKGKDVVISYTTHSHSPSRSLNVEICGIGALECSTGFYGPLCRLRCNCMSTGCDSYSGRCFRALCYSQYRGRNCASANILDSHNAEIKYSKSSMETWRNEHNHLPYSIGSIYDHEYKNWISWMAIQLQSVYDINSLSLVIKSDHVGHLRNILFDVHSSTERLDFQTMKGRFWKGLPCQISDYGNQQTIELPCSFQASLIVIVMHFGKGPNTVAWDDVKVWTCMDGTYGYRCEGICRCKDELEICNKLTGYCKSGCLAGFTRKNGRDCQPSRPDETTLKRCHCNHGGAGCAPEPTLCLTGCLPGWTGVACNITCPPGTYGANCEENCGNCRPSSDNRTCTPDEGICPNGCRNYEKTPQCTPKKGRSAYQETPQSSRTIKMMLIALVVALVGTIGCGFSVRFCSKRGAHNDEELARMKLKRDLSKDVNDQILREHMEYHEKFIKRDAMLKYQRSERDDRVSPVDAIYDKDRINYEMKRQMMQKIDQRPVGQGKPLGQDHEQQDADLKVAQWILAQDFEEFIQRRRERLANYKGNILDIKESVYEIPEVELDVDIHQLYDEIAPLELP